MATGQKISAQTAATTWSGTDQMTIVQSGVNKNMTHDVLMNDTQICKAWINFTTITNTVINDSFNVSSLTDNGTGDTTINLTNVMNNTYYSFVATSSTVGVFNNFVSTPPTTGLFRIQTLAGADTALDADLVSVQVFGS